MWRNLSLAITIAALGGTALSQQTAENLTVGPPTAQSTLSQFQDRTIALEGMIETLSKIITANRLMIQDLDVSVNAMYTPTEPWHTEIIYMNNHVNGIGSRCAATDAFLMQHMKNHNLAGFNRVIRGRQQ